MTQAGDALNVSHAAISQQMRVLEKHLGVSLVVRQGRGISLTPQGVELAAAVTAGFGQIGEVVEALTGADASRPLHISTTPAFTANWLMPRLGDFRNRHPEIELMLNPTPDLVQLKPGGIDVAVRFGSGGWPGVETSLLLKTDFIVAASRELIGDCQVSTPADLLDYPWIQELGTDEAMEWLRTHGVTSTCVKSRIHLPGNYMIDALRRGEGVALTTHALLKDDIEAGRVVVLFSQDRGQTGYHIVTRPGVLRPMARTFIGWMRRQVRENGA